MTHSLSSRYPLLCALAAVLLAGCANTVTYDVVILNGRVMDPETNLDAVRNVGIRGGEIARITSDSISGSKTIDASGLVVAPGFIDMHDHNTAAPFGQKLALRDGVYHAA